MLQSGHVSGMADVICRHFTAFRNFCCRVCFENKNIAKLKSWLPMGSTVSALGCPFQQCWCHCGNEKNTEPSVGVCGPCDPTWRINVSHPRSSTADISCCLNSAGKEAVEEHESVWRWPLCTPGAVPGVPASQSWAVPASGWNLNLNPVYNRNVFCLVPFGELEYRLFVIES